MNSPVLANLKLMPHLARALAARMDFLAWAGTVMLLSAAGLFIAALYADRESKAAAAHTVELRSNIDRMTATRLDSERSTPNLSVYYDKFPPANQVPALLKSMHESALKAGLDLAMADYRDVPVAGTPLGRYEVTLQVKATYPQLRTWLAELMNGWPTLAMAECGLKRDTVLAPGIDAQLKFVFFHRSR